MVNWTLMGRWQNWLIVGLMATIFGMGVRELFRLFEPNMHIPGIR